MGRLTLYPIDYRVAFASSLILSPLPHRRPLQLAFPSGQATGLLRSSLRSLRGWGRASRPVVRHPRQGSGQPLYLTTYLFWFKPDSIFGLLWITALISTSPGLTCPGLLAPDRRDAGSRRVGSRVHGRSLGSRLRCPPGFGPRRCRRRPPSSLTTALDFQRYIFPKLFLAH